MKKESRVKEQRVKVRTLPRTMSGMPGGLIRTFTKEIADLYIKRGWAEKVEENTSQRATAPSKKPEVSAATG